LQAPSDFLLTRSKGFLALVSQPLSVAMCGWRKAVPFAILIAGGTIALLAIPLIWIPTVAPNTGSCHHPETWPQVGGKDLFDVFTGNATVSEYAIDGCLHLQKVRRWSISLMYADRLLLDQANSSG
jgi:hypothetical protein